MQSNYLTKNILIMKKNSLTANKGLSLSQAQSISNLCNQRAKEIDIKISGINNYSKTVKTALGDTVTSHIIVVGKSIPSDVVAMLQEKAKLHACQGFLMENIKAKDTMLKQVKFGGADLSDINAPKRPEVINVASLMIDKVDDNFGWEQLTLNENNEYIEAVAFAAHIGQYIHNGGTLDKLRNELPNVKNVEWMTIKDGERSPVLVETHHTSAQLYKIHEELAGLHRGYEQRVNYFKAKVKNIVTNENARIAKHNTILQNDATSANNIAHKAYQVLYNEFEGNVRLANTKFEEVRQARIKEIVVMRINIDERFQEIINIFLKKMIVEDN